MGQLESYIYQSMFNIQNAIEQTYKQLDFNTIQKVAELLKSAKEFYLLDHLLQVLLQNMLKINLLKSAKILNIILIIIWS